MSKRKKSNIISLVLIILMFIIQIVYNLNYIMDYKQRVESGNNRWYQVEERIINVENRLDKIEHRVDVIEKGLK